MDVRRELPDTVKFIGAVQDEWQLYSNNPADYTLGQPIGFGASSVVYQAEYHSPSGESVPCALKVVDLDSLPMNSLPLLRRETQLMSLSKHPNVLRVRGTWVDGHKLCIALRLMKSGSVADVMQHGWPEGVEEEVAKCILKHALEGLNYLHINGFIHRDVKAANLLIDDDGTVLLGDLGVAVALHDDEVASTRVTVLSTSGSDASTVKRKTIRGKRMSFVGSPCWMAPEVVAQRQYDSKADLWSIGITALELAQGKAPQSQELPHEVLIKTLQDEPPILDREGGQFKYSKAFKEVVQNCLRKDPDERPTAADLLHMPFFRNTKKKDFLARTLLCGLPPLVERQQRRRISPSLSHFPSVSWDFTQIGQPSTPASLRLKESFEDGTFDGGDNAGIVRNPDKSRKVAFVASRDSERPGSSHVEIVNPIAEESPDQTRSTRPVSSRSSYEEVSYQPHKPHTPRSITMAPSRTFNWTAGKSPSSSSSSGLWDKFKRIGSKRLHNAE